MKLTFTRTFRSEYRVLKRLTLSLGRRVARIFQHCDRSMSDFLKKKKKKNMCLQSREFSQYFITQDGNRKKSFRVKISQRARESRFLKRAFFIATALRWYVMHQKYIARVSSYNDVKALGRISLVYNNLGVSRSRVLPRSTVRLEINISHRVQGA